MDAITSNIVANVERLLVQRGCTEDCTSTCLGWCRMAPPVLFVPPQVARVEHVPVVEAAPQETTRTSGNVSTTANVENTGAIPIVIYAPSQLFVDGDPAKGFRKPSVGRPGVTTWEGLIRLLSRAHEGDPSKYADPNKQKATRGGWSACALRDGRRLGSAFLETRLVGLDIDNNGDVETALQAFAPFKKMVLSTYKSTSEKPRCRVILLLKEPCCDDALFRRAHQAVRDAVVRGGWFKADDFDKAGADPERLWYLPMTPPGVPYVFRVTDGELLDLSKLVLNVKRPTIKSSAKPRKPNTNSSGALAFVERKMREATEGHRHTSAFSLAAWLSEIDPPIPDYEIEAAIMRYAPHGREVEFQLTVADGIRRGRAA